MIYGSRKARLTCAMIGLGFLTSFVTATPAISKDEKGIAEESQGRSAGHKDFTLCRGAAQAAGFETAFSLSDLSRGQEIQRPENKAPRSPDVARNLKKPPKKRGRAVLELGGLILYSQTRYWLNYAAYVEDWQFHLNWKDQRKRFFTFQAWTFDSNAFSLNWTHSFAGVLYYQFARTNHLSWKESFLYSLGGSLWWEYITEWREVISINDNIMTSIGGYAAGEPWFQLANYFNSREGTFNQLLGFLNPVQKLNRWLDRRQSSSWLPSPEPGWHDFHFFIGDRNMPTARRDKYQSNLFFGFQTWIINVPEYGKPGQSSRMITDILASEMRLDFTLRQGGIEEVNFATRVTGLGYFNQNVGENGRGYAYFVGLGSAFSLFKKRAVSIYDSDIIVPKKGTDLHLEEPRNFRDKLAAVHIAGPVFDYAVFMRNARLRLIIDAYLDFGLVNAFALNKYSAGHDIRGIKTTLLYYGYYYGLGTTLSSGITFDYKNLELTGLVRRQAYGSLDGRDRFQAEITDDIHVRDTRLCYKFGAAVRIPGTRVQIGAEYEGIRRRGTIKDVDERSLEERVSVAFSFRF